MQKTFSTAVTTKKIGSYLMLEKLGEGAFSKVKMGLHEDTGLKVAVKIIDNDAMDPDKMQREIALSRLLQHDNIVRLYDVVELPQKNATCLVMEYIEGGDLVDWLGAYGAASELQAVKWFNQLLDGVQFCHEKMVIHRDLKPDNILLDSDMNVKIADFGLSGMLKPGSLLQTFCGSAPYCSPEILLRHKYVGPEVDVWALGVILYAMLTANFPWVGKTWADQVKYALRGSWRPHPNVSIPCGNLLKRILEPDATKRATIQEIRAHPWLLSAAGAPVPFPRALSRSEVSESVLKNLQAMGFDPSQVTEDILTDMNATPGAVLYHILAGKPGPRTSKRADPALEEVPSSPPESSRSPSSDGSSSDSDTDSAGSYGSYKADVKVDWATLDLTSNKAARILGTLPGLSDSKKKKPKSKTTLRRSIGDLLASLKRRNSLSKSQ